MVINNVNSVVRKEGAEVRMGVSKKGEGEKNVRLGIPVLEEKGEGDNMVIVGKVVVPVGGTRRRLKARRVELREGRKDGGVAEDGRESDKMRRVMVCEGGRKDKEQKVKGKNSDMSELVDGKQLQQGQLITKFIPSFSTREEDRKWENAGMVVSVIVGDSALAIQQRVKDAGFSGG
jgi:hypothetical protein